MQKMNIGLSLDDDAPPDIPPPKDSSTTIQETNAEPSASMKSKQQNFLLDIEDSSASSKPKKMVKPNFGLAIDTEAINDLYTYGGEQGKKKTVEENEIEDFESGILELAT